MVNSFNVGNAIKNGVPVAIIGETNAGKSTLLNVLLNEDKAIVSDIHGTTRDIIEDTVNIGGITSDSSTQQVFVKLAIQLKASVSNALSKSWIKQKLSFG